MEITLPEEMKERLINNKYNISVNEYIVKLIGYAFYCSDTVKKNRKKQKRQNVRIEVTNDVIRHLFFLNVLKHSSDTHKNHHVNLLGIGEDDIHSFECIDCEVIFKSKLIP